MAFRQSCENTWLKLREWTDRSCRLAALGPELARKAHLSGLAPEGPCRVVKSATLVRSKKHYCSYSGGFIVWATFGYFFWIWQFLVVGSNDSLLTSSNKFVLLHNRFLAEATFSLLL